MPQTHIFIKTVLKRYDVRGIAGKTLTDTDAYFMGKSYGTLLVKKYKRKTCVMGYDGRSTSTAYADKLVKGLLESGINVTNIGLASTPMVYFAVQQLHKDAGIVVTASHNPPEYNGFKMLLDTEPIWGDDIQQLGDYAATGNFTNGKGQEEKQDVHQQYYQFLLEKLSLPPAKHLKIVWDSGNGVMASIMGDMAKLLPGKHITICNTLDSTFPNHNPDPSVEKNMEMLKKAVVTNDCDFGVGFDGDGDRIGVVDNRGTFLYGDQLLAILARDFLKQNPGEKVMSEVKASKVLYDDIRAHGGVPIMWTAGHSSQKAKMKTDHIKLAGETSGHIFYGENHNYDDALYAAIKLMNFIGSSPQKLSEILQQFPKTYSTPEIRVEVEDTKKFDLMREIIQRVRQKNRKFLDIDGVRVDTSDGWWLIRASNTLPELTTRCEALSQKGLKDCQKELADELAQSGLTIKYE
jgi:phosphomannomutase